MFFTFSFQNENVYFHKYVKHIDETQNLLQTHDTTKITSSSKKYIKKNKNIILTYLPYFWSHEIGNKHFILRHNHTTLQLNVLKYF